MRKVWDNTKRNFMFGNFFPKIMPFMRIGKIWYIQTGYSWQYNTAHAFACWITKATNTHSEYVILNTFQSHSGYANAPQCYVVRKLPALLSLQTRIFVCSHSLNRMRRITGRFKGHSKLSVFNLELASCHNFTILALRIWYWILHFWKFVEPWFITIRSCLSILSYVTPAVDTT